MMSTDCHLLIVSAVRGRFGESIELDCDSCVITLLGQLLSKSCYECCDSTDKAAAQIGDYESLIGFELKLVTNCRSCIHPDQPGEHQFDSGVILSTFRQFLRKNLFILTFKNER